MSCRMIVIAGLICLSSGVYAQVVSDFNTGDDGWQVLDQNQADPATVTNPGGYISAEPVSGQPHFWFAPAKFLGNRAYTSYGETLSFDLQTESTTPAHSVAGDVMLSNGTTSIFLDITPLPATAPGWTNYTIKLDETQLWKVGSIGGATATREQVIGVLSSLTIIRIYTQWQFAGNIRGGLDNVVLNVHAAAPPTPVITSFTPAKAIPGNNITITGTDFGTTAAANVVYFGGVKGVIQSASQTQIVVKIPTSADYARLTVINLTTGRSGVSKQYFAPLQAAGSSITITPGTFDRYVSFNRQLGWMSHGDLNGDGKNELVCSNGTLISIFENTSTPGKIDAGTFGPRLDLDPSLPSNYAEISVADLDNDGKAEVFFAMRDNPDAGRIVVLPNIHTSGPITAGSFGPAREFRIPPHTAVAAHADDLDGDGRPELISWGSSCAPNPAYILMNISTPGDINFTAASFSLPGLSSCGGRYETSDLDGDGKIDLVMVTDNNTRIFRNTSVPGTLSFATPFDLADGSGTCSIGDMDNDNKPDIVFAAGGMKVFKNNSTPGNLTAASFSGVIVFSGGISQAKVADLNGDGKPDVVAGGNFGGLVVYQNVTPDGVISSGSFRPAFSLDAGGNAASELDVADFDNDGRADLVSNVGNFANLTVLRNNSAPPPQINSLSAIAAPPGSTITISGANFSSTPGNQSVWFGQAKATVNNASTTSLEVVVPIGASYDQISIALNGNVIYSKDFFTPTFSGGSPFTAASFASAFERTVNTANAVEVCDFDVDGKVDIISDNNSSLAILRNVGTTGTIDATTFAATTTLGTSGGLMRKGDFDADGKPDLVITTNMTRNISNVALPNPIAFDIYLGRDQNNPGATDFANFRDMNNDGKIDVTFTGNAVPALYVQGNQARADGFTTSGNATSTFLQNVNFSRGSTGGSVAVADFDGDGFNDAVTCNPTTNNLSLFRNQQLTLPMSSALFNAGVTITAGNTPSRIAAADFDLDGKPDLVVTNNVNSTAATISVFRNTSTVGTMSFARQDFQAALAPVDVAVADMDGDGKVDIVVSNQNSNSFSIFRNLSTTGVLDVNSFAAKVDYTVASAPRALAVGDVDGDLRPDVIITRNTPLAVVVYKNAMPLGPIISITQQPGNATACENGTVSYTVAATGANNLVYAWQKFNTTNSAFENLTASATVTGVNTSTLTITSIAASMNGDTYRCRVTGDGAAEKFSDQATLTTSAAPAAPTTSGATACKGSSLTLSAAGSTDGNYRWFDSPTGQPINDAVNSTLVTPVIFTTTTFYAAAVNSIGCVSARTAAVATIAPITKPTITSAGTMLCGVNAVKISGPAGFSAYNWSNGASTQEIDVSFTGSYSLIVSDANGCQSLSSDPIVVTTGSVAKPVISASKPRLCSTGDQLVLSGPAGMSGYEWSTGATTATLTVATAGVYSLIVVNSSGCRSLPSDGFTVTVGAVKPTISVGANVLVSSPAKTYQWYFRGVAVPEATTQFLDYNPFSYGEYKVVVTDVSDCTAESDVFINLVTGAESTEPNAEVYPNPFSDKLVLDVDADEAKMFDTTGKMIRQLVKGENDVSQLARGMYLVRLRKGNQLKTIKVLK